MTTQSQPNENETIIRFSSAWWAYIFFRLGLLRAFVNGVEDALAITGRFLLLVFLIYCGAKAGFLLADPNTVFPPMLEMGMFILQLAGLEGSIPGLARQADELRARQDEATAKKVDTVMLSARVMTVLSIAEGALHALHVAPTWLQVISAILLVVRGVVITGFLIALAKVESRSPRVLSKDAHARELEQRTQRDEQARMVETLRAQLDEAIGARIGEQQKGQQREIEHTCMIERLREQVKELEAAHSSLLTGTQSQGDIMRLLQSQLGQTEERLRHVTAEFEQKQADFERVAADLHTAHLRMTDLQNAVDETAHLREAYQDLSAKLHTADLHIADLTAKLERAKRKSADLHTANGDVAQSVSTRSPMAGSQQREQADQTKITSIDQARAKHEGGGQSRAKMSHAEVVAFMTANPGLKRAEVAERLGISERKVYDAVAWAKEQEQSEQEHAASDR